MNFVIQRMCMWMSQELLMTRLMILKKLSGTTIQAIHTTQIITQIPIILSKTAKGFITSLPIDTT